MGKHRIAIVDAADEMNRNSANAVLKILEKPPPKRYASAEALEPPCFSNE